MVKTEPENHLSSDYIKFISWQMSIIILSSHIPDDIKKLPLERFNPSFVVDSLASFMPK